MSVRLAYRTMSLNPRHQWLDWYTGRQLVRETQMREAPALELRVCLECGVRGAMKEMSDGDVTCTSCGLVNDRNAVSDRAEWRTFADDTGAKDESGNRCGCSTSSSSFHVVGSKNGGGGGGGGAASPHPLLISGVYDARAGGTAPTTISALRRTQCMGGGGKGREDRPDNMTVGDHGILYHKLDLFDATADVRATTAELYSLAKFNIGGGTVNGAGSVVRGQAKMALMGACFYIAMRRRVDLQRVMRTFEIDRARSVNLMINKVDTDPDCSSLCKRVFGNNATPKSPMTTTTPLTTKVDIYHGGWHHACDAHPSVDDALGPEQGRRQCEGHEQMGGTRSTVRTGADTPDTPSDFTAITSQDASAESVLQFTGIAMNIVNMWVTACQGETPTRFALRVRCIKAQFKFRCAAMKDALERVGAQGSLNPTLFHIGIALVVCEHTEELRHVKGRHLVMTFERASSEAILNRNAVIVRSVMARLCRQGVDRV